MNKNNGTVAILGSTGSVGTQSVEVARHLGLKVDLLLASSSVDKLEKQARELNPRVCVMTDEKAADELKIRLSDTQVKVYSGEKSALSAIEESEASTAVDAVGGFAGLAPAMACARSGKRIAMSNKEAIIVAYGILKKAIDEGGAELVPVDSEHSAIFQCLDMHHKNPVKRIILTSSGGPFRGKSRELLKSISAKDALAHPTWKMGAKITVDSASLMNKGFEIIEAVRLFGVKPEQVKVVVHPQSIMHSAVEYIDNSVIAEMGAPDMRTCIQYALTYPERKVSLAKPLDFASIGSITFEEPDTDTFTLLPLAYYAIGEDGVIPAVLNASDEVAVSYFLRGEIGFTDIFDIVENTVRNFKNIKNPSLEEIINADKESRIIAAQAAEKIIKA